MSEAERLAAKPVPTRAFGRFALQQLLGKSDRSMAWLAFDPRIEQEVVLVLPRAQPPNAAALDKWLAEARHAARLKHPHLAHVVDIGVQDQWPYAVVDRALGLTVGERLASDARRTPEEAVAWLIQLLQGLAFLHEAGLAHGDIQPHQILVNDQGLVSLMGVGAPFSQADGAGRGDAMPLDPHRLREVREFARIDVLAVGVLMHVLLSGQAALDEPDIGRVIARLPPQGKELVRLPWITPHPVPEGLRAIANRATSVQERQRYHGARTLLNALSNWQEVAAQSSGGALALLIDRLHSVGHLPASPGVGARVGRLAMSDKQRTGEMAKEILDDVALSLELLRQVNSAHVQGTQRAGSGVVLSIRRAVALVGIKGVRQAAAALRAWPGPLSELQAEALRVQLERVRQAGLLAQMLRPPGYDPEVVYLIAVLQNLGRLMVQYHFPEESGQIQALTRDVASSNPGEPDLMGMTEESAAYAVLGVDIESLGTAVARYWGLTDDAMHMIRRPSVLRPVRAADNDLDRIRLAASAANETMDAAQLAAHRLKPALEQIAQRYGRPLSITLKDLTDGLQAVRSGRHASASAPSIPASVDTSPEEERASEAPSQFAALLASRNA